MKQDDLLEQLLASAPASLPYQAHSETSREAATTAVHDAATQRLRVLAFLRRHGPATDEAIQIALGIQGSTQRPRRVELVAMQLVRDSGQKGRTASGRRAVLWEATR